MPISLDYSCLFLVPVTRIVGDVTARRSKMHGEFVSLKQRPVTGCAVSYGIDLSVAKFYAWASKPNTSA